MLIFNVRNSSCGSRRNCQQSLQILAISTRIFWSKLHTETAGSVTNGMQLHSVMDPKLCPPRITSIPPYTSMADHDELPSFYKSKQFFADGLLLLVMLYFITIFSYWINIMSKPIYLATRWEYFISSRK